MNVFACLQGHENEKERLTMEMEAIKRETSSMENQLASLRDQINALTSDVEEQKLKVTPDICWQVLNISFSNSAKHAGCFHKKES